MKMSQHISDQRSFSIPPGNIGKPEVLWCLRGVQKKTSGIKWVKGACYSHRLHFTLKKWNDRTVYFSSSYNSMIPILSERISVKNKTVQSFSNRSAIINLLNASFALIWKPVNWFSVWRRHRHLMG